jgi:hypothetical protein
MRTRASKRAWNFERRLEKEKGEAIAKKIFRKDEGEIEKEKKERIGRRRRKNV